MTVRALVAETAALVAAHAGVAAVVGAGKALLGGMYHSTDMEVHRNWMAVVWHTPVRRRSGWRRRVRPLWRQRR